MARNLKRENIKKLIGIETKNGFKVDVANYMYNPSYDHQYPNLIKKVSEDENTETIRSYRYFKFYDGNGKYEVSDTVYKKADGNGWRISNNNTSKTLIENERRFSMKKLIELAEADE